MPWIEDKIFRLKSDNVLRKLSPNSGHLSKYHNMILWSLFFQVIVFAALTWSIAKSLIMLSTTMVNNLRSWSHIKHDLQPWSQKKIEISIIHFCFTSGYTSYNQIFCSNWYIQKSIATFSCDVLHSKYDIRYSSSKRAVYELLGHSVLCQHIFCRKTFWKFLCPILKIDTCLLNFLPLSYCKVWMYQS